MFHRMRAVTGGGLLLAQVLFLAVVPTADARLEADSLEPHARSVATAAGFHDPHPSHDHRLCDLCRALSIGAGPVALLHPSARVPEHRLEPSGIPNDPAVITQGFLPVVPRAPPVV